MPLVAHGRFLQCCLLFLFLGPGLSAAPVQEVLLVASGGWKSCKNGIDRQFIGTQFDQLVADLKTIFPQHRFSFIKTCTDLPAAKWEVPFRWVYRGARGDWTSTVTPEGLAGLVRKYRVTQADRIFWIGHSYGGWHAMVGSSRLGNSDGLFTLEPISAAECDVRDYLENRSKRLIKRRQVIHWGCRQAPTDVSRPAVAASANGQWVNYILPDRTRTGAVYLKGDIYSSAVTEAENLIYAIPPGDRAHHLLGLDAGVWQSMCQKISLTLGQADGGRCSQVRVDAEGRRVSAR